MISEALIKANTGSPVTICCNSLEKIRWYYNSLYGDSISNNTCIMFDSVNLNNTGDYFCYGKYGGRNNSSFVAQTTLNVYGKL